MSLEHNNYFIPLIGLSWNSNTEWDTAKSIANESGAKLADFILNYLTSCKQEQQRDISMRLIAHSMGSRVILSALQNLHENSAWNDPTNNFKITSIHLMGAAVDDEEVSMNTINEFNQPSWGQAPLGCYPNHYYTGNGVKFPYGTTIAEEVVKFYNLINPEDNVLQFIYPCFEGGDDALGMDGRQQSGILPPPGSVYQKKTSKQKYNLITMQMQLRMNALFALFGCGSITDGWDFGLCNHYGYCQVEREEIIMRDILDLEILMI